MVTTLFLRFINVMINDAILQLDEGLQVGVANCNEALM